MVGAHCGGASNPRQDFTIVSTCVEKLPCDDCGSSDSLQTYLNIDEALGIEWYTSFCHGACWENKGDPYNGDAPEVHVKTEAELREEIETIRSCKVFTPRRPWRGIPPAEFGKWGSRLLLSEFDGKTPYGIAFPFTSYGDLIGWKCRALFKKGNMWAMGTTAGADMYGTKRAQIISKKNGLRTLYITEGEYDAIALNYCMWLFQSMQYPVVSATNGGGSLYKNIEDYLDRFHKHFDRIVLVMDDDEVGRLAVNDVVEGFPKLNIAACPKPYGAKDANEALEAGHGKLMGQLALSIN